MNVAELDRLVADTEEFHDGASITTDAGTLRTLARRVIAAEKLVEALHTARDYVSDSHIGALVHDDGKRVSEAMTTEDLAMIGAAITAYEATQ